MNDNPLPRSPALRSLGLLTSLLGIAPLYLYIAAPTFGPWLAALPLAFGALCYPLSLLPKRPRVPLLIALCLCAGAYGWLIPGLTGGWRIFYTLLCAALPLAALPSLLRDRLHIELSVGVIATLVCWLLWRAPVFRAFRTYVLYTACAFLPLLMLYVNLSQLDCQRRAQRGARPSGLIGANVALTGAFVVLTFLIANAKAIWNAVKALLSAIIEAIWALLSLAPTGEEPIEPIEAGQSEMPVPADAPATSPFWKVLEGVMTAAVILLAIAALCLFIRRLPAILRKIRAALRALIGRYLHAISTEGGDYTDDSEDLRADEGRYAKQKKRRRRVRLPRWDDMNNRQRVRAVYRRAVDGAASPLRTARENLQGLWEDRPEAARRLADGYDRARYSEHEITEAEAAAARETLP